MDLEMTLPVWLLSVVPILRRWGGLGLSSKDTRMRLRTRRDSDVACRESLGRWSKAPSMDLIYVGSIAEAVVSVASAGALRMEVCASRPCFGDVLARLRVAACSDARVGLLVIYTRATSREGKGSMRIGNRGPGWHAAACAGPPVAACAGPPVAACARPPGWAGATGLAQARAGSCISARGVLIG